MDRNYRLFRFNQLTKNGTQFLTGEVALPINSIMSLRRSPVGSEVYLDGGLSLIGGLHQEWVSIEDFEVLVTRYEELIKEIE